MAVSNSVAFANPNAPVYPRLAQGKVWNEVSLIFSTLHFSGNMPYMVYKKSKRFIYFAYKIYLSGKKFVTSCWLIFLFNPFFGVGPVSFM